MIFKAELLPNRQNFENLFPFFYFNLTKQKLDIKDGVTKLAFHYELSGETATKLQYLRPGASRARGKNRTAKCVNALI